MMLFDNQRYVCPKCGFISDKAKFLTSITDYWVTDSNGMMQMIRGRELSDGKKLPIVEIICIDCGERAEIKEKTVD